MNFECPFCKCRCESETNILNEIVQCPQCGKDFIPQTYHPEPLNKKFLTPANTTSDTPNHKQTLTGKGLRKNSLPDEFELPKICRALRILELLSLILAVFGLVIPTGAGICTKNIELIAAGLTMFTAFFLIFLTILSVYTVIKLLAKIEFNTRQKS